ncbi:2-haloacrylate reductase [Sesamum alatum]|uniref:Probable quinone oxidoreductase n=1 Tax=Sesamum alatum TaxID=300844 RepID=A0AAE2CRD4_9LAMI|nr:2-haloacrylate reductase [Sesamum alatum]
MQAIASSISRHLIEQCDSSRNQCFHPSSRNSVIIITTAFHKTALPGVLLHSISCKGLLSKPTLSAVKFQNRSSSWPISSSVVVGSKMVKAIRVHELGGPEVLKWEDVEIGEPNDGFTRLLRSPFTPGMEAVGVVTAVGPGLTGRKVGDLVAYAGNPMGAYAEEQILPADKVVPVPPSIDPIIAASVMLKGMTAQFLVRQCFKVEPGHTVLIHAAAGGVGSLLCQWANALGATVIGTVSTKEKAAQAKEDGCHHVILYKEEDFVTRVNEITSGKGVEVVYDSVGKDTFEGSLTCLKLRGYMVSFGQSSGTPDPVPLSALAAKSLFLTRPSLMHYTITRDELLQTASEVFTNLAAGVLRVRVNHTYPLSQAAQAHADLENRKTSGSVVLLPDGN